MAVNSARPRERIRVRSFGTYRFHGSADQPVMSIARDLTREAFPSEVGEEVEVLLVEDPDDEPYVELRPSTEHPGDE